MTKLTPVHPGNRIELPPEWAAEIGLAQYAALEKTKEGILVHPCSGATWDEVFAQRLQANEAGGMLGKPDQELNGDDVLL